MKVAPVMAAVEAWNARGRPATAAGPGAAPAGAAAARCPPSLDLDLVDLDRCPRRLRRAVEDSGVEL